MHQSLPVELDGIDTDQIEVAGHRNMKRISTDRSAWGCLRVMNDGIIGRSENYLSSSKLSTLMAGSGLKI